MIQLRTFTENEHWLLSAWTDVPTSEIARLARQKGEKPEILRIRGKVLALRVEIDEAHARSRTLVVA